MVEDIWRLGIRTYARDEGLYRGDQAVGSGFEEVL